MLSPAESHDRFSRVASKPTAIVSLNSSHTWDFCFSYCLSCFPLSLLLYTHHLQGEPCYRVWLLGHRLSPLWQGKCVVWSWEISVRYIWVHIRHIRQALETVSWKGAGLFQDCAWTCPEAVGLYIGGFAGGWQGCFLGPSGRGTGSDCCLFLCSHWQFRLPSLLEFTGWRAGVCSSIILLGVFNAHTRNDSETWRSMIGRNSLPDLNLSGLLCK